VFFIVVVSYLFVIKVHIIIMSNKNKMLIVDKKDLKRLMSEKKSIAARNEKKIESRFAKYPFLR